MCWDTFFPCSLGGVAIHSFPYKVLMVPWILYYSSRCIVLLNKHYYNTRVSRHFWVCYQALITFNDVWSAGPSSPPPPRKELPELTIIYLHKHLLSHGAGGGVGKPLQPAVDPPPLLLLLLLLIFKKTSALPDHCLFLLAADDHPATGVDHLHLPLG